MMRRCVFLDRDGVINRDSGYVSKWEDFEFLPGALESMRRINEAGFDMVIVTNQSGIARGYYTLDDYQKLTNKMINSIESAGACVLGVYFCPHLPQGAVSPYCIECDCRKPAPGMILRASEDHGIDLSNSIMVGDKMSDMDAATAAGIRCRYLINNRDQYTNDLESSKYDGIFVSLAEFTSSLQEFEN